MMTANHILSQEGILTTFSIAKKVTTKDVKKLREKMKDAKLDASQLQEALQQSIIEDAAESVKKCQIPGLIVEGVTDNNNKSEDDPKIMELTYFASLVAKKISEKKMDKYYICYIINALVNMLRLNDNDFEQFHKRFNKYKNNEDDSESGNAY